MYVPSVQRVVVPTMHRSTGARLPENSELRRIAQDVLATVKYAVCVHAMDPSQPARGSEVDQVITAAIRSMPPEKQRRYHDTAAELLAAGPAVRRGVFGRYASIDPDSARRLGVRGMREQLGPVQVDLRLLGLARPGRGGSRLDELEATWGLVVADPILPKPPGDIRTFAGSTPSGDPSIPFPGYFKTLEFVVRWIHCVDETSPEWPGSDEIGIGGVAIGHDGSSTGVAQKVFTEFDDGNKEWFTPLWKFAVFSRPAPTSGEVKYDTYAVIVALAEKDGGGFGYFINQLWDAVRDGVQDIITRVVTLGQGPDAPEILNLVATVVNNVTIWAIEELVLWFLQLFQDQIFEPTFSTISTPRGFILFGPDNVIEGSSVRTPFDDLHFYGFGGHYAVRYAWRFTDWVAGSGAQ